VIRILGDRESGVALRGSRSGAFDETAAYGGGCKFASVAVVKTPELLDGHEFEAGEFEGAPRDELFEFCYGDLVEASGHFAESCCPIGLESGAPTDQGLLAEK
jgi:hypothetical protein